jgi:predicted secreted hydrolase
LMLFHIRRKDGSIDPYSAATFVDAQGRAHHLKAGDFLLERSSSEIESGATWTSSATHATYPIQWTIRVPSLGVALQASTALPSQELASNSKIVPSYWEGAICLAGTKNGAPLNGAGYLEMTGYDRPVGMR